MYNYSPDETKIVVDGKRLEGFAENFLANASSRGFTLKLHGGSPWHKYLDGLVFSKYNKTVDVSVEVDLKEDEVASDLFNIEGDFILISWNYSLGSSQFPEVSYTFVRNSPIYQ